MAHPNYIELVENAVSTLENALQRLAGPNRNGVAEEQIEEAIADLRAAVGN